MVTFKFVLAILAAVLLVVGIIYRKKSWGQKLLYFSLGMLVMYFFTYFIWDFIEGTNEAENVLR